MSNQYISIQNLKFLLFEVHGTSGLLKSDYFNDYDEEAINYLIDSSKDFADKMLFPYFKEMDRQGVTMKDGEVIAHPKIYETLNALGESGWMVSNLAKESGGLQLPYIVHVVTELIYYSANNSGVGHAGLTAGAGKLIYSFGSDRLQEQYASKMMAGEWQGTMAMTEPEAGSALSDLTTKAIDQKNGTYKIQGQKIFISGGDYKEVANVVHLTLARVEGAPAGTKGISLFVIPKKRLSEGGKLVPNDVTTAGLFHKLGQRGYVTTHLIFGEKHDCLGYLVGQENMGLVYMFQMMNEARIGVGVIGAGIASAAYYASLAYANERLQGKRISNDSTSTSTPSKIIEHADVRRMLFHQKAISEGAISLIMECAKFEDLIKITTGDEKLNNQLMLDILTPMVKTYASEKGSESVSNGLQVLGGYGYCVDFPLEQLYRDIRITSLYEGTTGIQSIDLLGRKMTMHEGRAAKLLLSAINDIIDRANKFSELKVYADALHTVLNHFQDVVEHLMGYALKGEQEQFLANANLFMEFACQMTIGWQWLKQAIVAMKHVNDAYQSDFFESKIETMKYFFAYEIPKIESLKVSLMDSHILTIKGKNEPLL